MGRGLEFEKPWGEVVREKEGGMRRWREGRWREGRKNEKRGRQTEN